MTDIDVLIIGAGASGLMAAIQSAGSGARTMVCERNKRPGIKLSITGKGKCNITNTACMDDFIGSYGKNGRYLKPVFYRFFNSELVDFFNSIGIPVKAERGGRVFPVHEDSRELVHKLYSRAVSAGAAFIFNARISKLLVENEKISSVILEDGRILKAKAFIIACGGASYPSTGSSGDGYLLAIQAGHHVLKALPALVPLETREKIPPSMYGLILKNISLNVWIDGKKTASFSGEMKFREFGIDGPVVLSASRIIAGELQSGKSIKVTIDLKPAIDEKTLDQRLLGEIQDNRQSTAGKMMENLLPAGMVAFFLETAGIDDQRKCAELTSDNRKKIKYLMKNFPLEISRSRPFPEAIITQGGVDVREIDFHTMRSKTAVNLFFAGEVIDVDAETGGFNLQAAFSTGWLAGKSATEEAKQH